MEDLKTEDHEITLSPPRLFPFAVALSKPRAVNTSIANTIIIVIIEVTIFIYIVKTRNSACYWILYCVRIRCIALTRTGLRQRGTYYSLLRFAATRGGVLA